MNKVKNIFKAIIYFSAEISGINKLLAFFNKGKVVALMFHNVTNSRDVFSEAISTAQFLKILDKINQNYNLVYLDQSGDLQNYNQYKVNIMLTFDDGFYNNYETVYPLLLQKKMKAIFFIISNCLPEGKIPEFAYKYSKNPRHEDMLRTISSKNIAEMVKDGMSIGSHGTNHSNFKNLSQGETDAELKNSNQELEKLVSPITSFAYPWGMYKESDLSKVKETYRNIFTTRSGWNNQNTTLWNRTGVSGYYHCCAIISGLIFKFK